MKVSIKKFDVDMEVKNKGIEMEIRKPNGDFMGDVVLTKTKLIWCKGQTGRQNGESVTWEKFIEWMETR